LPFLARSLGIPDVMLIEVRAFEDGRGFFSELFKQSEFLKMGINGPFLQDNFSRSSGGTLRGLHYQIEPRAQSKLVFALRGEIYDVAADIRRGSPHFGHWVGEVLSDKNHRALYVPAGFAHGYCVTSPEADVMYKVDQEYSPNHERGIRWDDSALKIKWPVAEPLLSTRDASLPTLDKAENNFVFG